MTRAPQTWTVVNPGPCPHCRANTDASCKDDRHHCVACGADRGPCDQVSSAPHVQQLALPGLDP